MFINFLQLCPYLCMEVMESIVLNVLVPMLICILYDERTLSLSVSRVTLFPTYAHCAQPHAVPFL